jgi:glycosyltransferase involved in cell wall biosynthesis
VPGRDVVATIGIDARLVSGTYGGVEQFVIGLASGLGTLADSGDEYLFLVYRGHTDWLAPFLGDNARMVEALEDAPIQNRLQAMRSAVAERAPVLRRSVRWLSSRSPQRISVPRSDGALERAGAQLIHFPLQNAFLTDLPSIYQPWDLQHRHLPGFFSPATIAWRDATYMAFCNQASLVIATSEWHRDDFQRAYGVPRDRMVVIPVPPPLQAYRAASEAELAEASQRLSLPQRFLYYPAQTWPHKNHSRLIRAIAFARDEYGTSIQVVCSGRLTSHYASIKRVARQFGVTDQLTFVGYVEPSDVQALYRLSVGLVFPSLFEGWGIPIVEAFWAGIPVVCSDIPSLPTFVRFAALQFDPTDTAEMGRSMMRIWTDRGLRADLAARGGQCVAGMSWHTTAGWYRETYRDILDKPGIGGGSARDASV